MSTVSASKLFFKFKDKQIDFVCMNLICHVTRIIPDVLFHCRHASLNMIINHCSNQKDNHNNNKLVGHDETMQLICKLGSLRLVYCSFPTKTAVVSDNYKRKRFLTRIIAAFPN
jgi:hypothetical protein